MVFDKSNFTTEKHQTIHRPLIPMVFCHILNDGSTVLSRSVMSDSLRPMDGSLIGSSVQGILQARILKWVAISFSRGSSWSKDQTWVSCSTGRFFFFFFGGSLDHFYCAFSSGLLWPVIIFSFYFHTLTWISLGYTCIPHPDPRSHLPLHPIPLGLPSAPGLSTCLMHPTWAGDLFHPR